jgi:hypothetical protein
MQIYCPNCGRGYTQKLKETWLVVCDTCHHLVKGSGIEPDQLNMPDDWSTIQVGTTGLYKNQNFTIMGRIRLQMKNDFRNLWCAQYGQEIMWIGQSLESIGFFTPPFAPFPHSFGKIRAGVNIEFSERIKLKCELVENCIGLQYEGEVSDFPFPKGNFTLIQAGNAIGNTVLIFYENPNSIQFLWGEVMLVYGVTFNNTKTWSQWEAK